MLSTKTAETPHWFVDLIFISLFLGLLYAIWIGSYALFTPDEGRYSEVAREMIVTGDYITPRLNGVPFLDKPILYYWLQASAIKMFGLKEWSLRFWPAIIGVFGCLAVYISGRLLFTRRSALLSTIILGTSPLYYGVSHYANLDLEVAVFISNSLLFFIVAMQAPTKKRRDIFLVFAYIFSGLAVLTKGLIGIVFPIMIIGAWVLVLNRWEVIAKMRLLLGLFIFMLICFPWYFLAQQANPQFFQFFFVTQQLTRFLTQGDFNNQTVIWFYFPIVIAGFLPWIFFVIQAFAYHLKLIWQDRLKHQTELFLILWCVLIFMFFSIPKSKTIGYITPIFPVLALLVGNYLSTHWDIFKSKGMYFGTKAVAPIFLIAGVTFLLLPQFDVGITPNLYPYIRVVGTSLLLAGAAITFLSYKKQFSPIFICLTLATCVFLLTMIASAHVINYKTIKPLALLLKIQLKPTDEIVTYYRYYQDLPIYLERRITVVANWNAEDILHYDNWQRELWFNMHYLDTTAWLIKEPTLWERWQGNTRLFVLMNKDFYSGFLERLQKATQGKGNVYSFGSLKLAKHEEVVVVSNRES